MFEEFNFVTEFDEQFDDFKLYGSLISWWLYRTRGDFGDLIQKLCKFCGTQSVFAVFIEKLKTNVAKAQQNPTITNWSAIECVITCISELTYNGQFHDVKAL